jgi:hypothetical protein
MAHPNNDEIIISNGEYEPYKPKTIKNNLQQAFL